MTAIAHPLARHWLIRSALIATALCVSNIGNATGAPASAPVAAAGAVAPVQRPALVSERNFPLLHILSTTPDYRQAMSASPAMQALIAARTARIDQAAQTCRANAECLLSAWLWTPEDIAAVEAMLATDRRFASLASQHLRPSGLFARFAAMNDQQLTAAAWRATAEGMNGIIRTYGLGAAPRYPAIDAMSFDKADPVFIGLISDAVSLLRSDEGRQVGGIDAAAQMALDLLYLNERENAGFFPDLDSRDNAVARTAAAQTDWTAFPYTLILVLGDGPDEAGRELGSYGKLRLRHAVTLYRQGLAPFLVVSGGNVHPARTAFNEALEMKRELIERYGIPEAAIIMEPYARHTTTNFRNTARLMIRYGIPLDRDALVTTSTGHSLYAGGPLIQQRSEAELGYQPMRIIRRLGPFDLVFRAEPISSHRDPRDPLDP